MNEHSDSLAVRAIPPRTAMRGLPAFETAAQPWGLEKDHPVASEIVGTRASAVQLRKLCALYARLAGVPALVYLDAERSGEQATPPLLRQEQWKEQHDG